MGSTSKVPQNGSFESHDRKQSEPPVPQKCPMLYGQFSSTSVWTGTYYSKTLQSKRGLQIEIGNHGTQWFWDVDEKKEETAEISLSLYSISSSTIWCLLHCFNERKTTPKKHSVIYCRSPSLQHIASLVSSKLFLWGTRDVQIAHEHYCFLVSPIHLCRVKIQLKYSYSVIKWHSTLRKVNMIHIHH